MLAGRSGMLLPRSQARCTQLRRNPRRSRPRCRRCSRSPAGRPRGGRTRIRGRSLPRRGAAGRPSLDSCTAVTPTGKSMHECNAEQTDHAEYLACTHPNSGYASWIRLCSHTYKQSSSMHANANRKEIRSAGDAKSNNDTPTHRLVNYLLLHLHLQRKACMRVAVVLS